MAEDKIKYEDLIESDLFKRIEKGANDSIEAISKLEAKFKDILKVTADIAKNSKGVDIDNLRKREKAIEDNAEAVEKLSKAEKDRIRLEEKLKSLSDAKVKANEAIKLNIQEQTRATKEAIKIEGELGAYKAKSALLSKLKNEYKDLAAEEKANTKEAKLLLKQVQKLDAELKDLDSTVGDNQRRIGNYVGAVKKLIVSLDTLSKVAVIGVLSGLADTFKGSEAGASALEKALLQVTVRLSLFVTAIVKAAKVSSGFDFFEKLSEQLAGFEEKAEKAIDSGERIVDANIAMILSIAKLRTQMALLVRQEAEFTISADDNTLSLKAQREALDSLQEATTARLQKQIEIARAEEALAQARRDQSARLREDATADASIEAELAEARVTRAEAEAELTEFTADVMKRRREILRDDAELELDILIDAADNLKMIRERIISDESVSVSERKALLKQTESDLDASFAAQIALIEKLTGAEIDSAELIAETDTKKLNERVKAIAADEITQTRLLEVIRERRTAVQDLAEANRDLSGSERGLSEQTALNALSSEAIAELEKAGADLKAVLDSLEADTLQAEIDALKERLAVATEGSNLFAEVQAELNDKLLAQQQARIEKEQAVEEAANKKKLEAQQEYATLAIGLARTLAERRAEVQNEAIERELEGNRERQTALRALAEQGNQSAEASLAEAERREAELEKRKQETARRQARVELALSAVETYSNKVSANDPNPLASTITDISVLQAFINSLPAFWGGAENVGEALGKPQLSGRDGHLVRVDGRERIMTARQNELIGGISNNDLAMMAFANRTGKGISEADDTSQVVSQKLDGVQRAIENQPVYLGQDFKVREGIIIDLIKKGRRIERKHRKSGGIWGK